MTRECDTECGCPCHIGAAQIRCECYTERPVRALRTPPPPVRAVARVQPRRKPQGGSMDRRRDGRPLLETAIEAYLHEQVRLKGGTTFKIQPIRKGLPDRAVLSPYGRQYLVEMKKADGVVSPAQTELHKRMRGMGHVVHVLASKAEVDAFVRWIVATGPGLRNAKRQFALDLEATANGYFVPDVDTKEDLEALL